MCCYSDGWLTECWTFCWPWVCTTTGLSLGIQMMFPLLSHQGNQDIVGYKVLCRGGSSYWGCKAMGESYQHQLLLRFMRMLWTVSFQRQRPMGLAETPTEQDQGLNVNTCPPIVCIPWTHVPTLPLLQSELQRNMGADMAIELGRNSHQ